MTKILEHALAHRPARSISSYPALRPLPGQERRLRECMALARRHGLTLPDFTVRWVDAPTKDVEQGATVRHARTGALTVWLNAAAYPRELDLTILHELQHVADFASKRPLSRLEMERHAVAFVARVMGW